MGRNLIQINDFLMLSDVVSHEPIKFSYEDDI